MNQELTKSRIFEQMRRVYDWQVANPVRQVTRTTGKQRFIKDTDWERGVFWSAVSTAWLETQDETYFQGLMNYTLHTGYRPGPSPRFADDHVCCLAYLDVYPQVQEPDYLDYIRRAFDIMLDNPRPGREDWYWCDALFMAPASFVALSKVTGEEKYQEYANTAYWDTIDYLWDNENDLIYRDKRYIPNSEGTEFREANGEKVFWSRGIGWVLASIPRILKSLPKDHQDYNKYIELFSKLAKQVIKYQHEDGFWRASLLDPDNFPNPESSATGLFCYGLAWGINQNILDKEHYLPVVEKAWLALVSAIHSTGMIGWVQLPAFNPREVKFEHNIEYGAGAFLLAGSEVSKLYA